MKRLLIYIAGFYWGTSESEMFAHIMQAMDCAIEVWKTGHIAICPHLNTMFMGEILSDKRWIEGNLEILKKCDGMMIIPGCKVSEKVAVELDCAGALKIPIYWTFDEFRMRTSEDRND